MSAAARVGALLAALAGCEPAPAPEAPRIPPAPAGAVLVGAGDIAVCGSNGHRQTAALLDQIPGVVFTLGDHVYPSGTLGRFQRCYHPSWGRHRERTRPVPGNHEYRTRGARGYFRYFGARAGKPGRGYYSYDLGGWHVVALNSEVDADAGSAQERWLRADLAANPRRCILAYWHRPLFSSGEHGGDPRTRALWRALEEAGAEVVVTGHDHLYERFTPQTAAGAADPERGIRQFVVGTGGARGYRFGEPVDHSEVRYNATPGVLRLVLLPDGYRWDFFPVSGEFADSGTGRCR